MTCVVRVISGGQTGADQGALFAAEILGIPTGGWMPRGFRTETGPRPDFAQRFGLKEHPSPNYPPRTEANVREADATLIFGNPAERGSALTARICGRLRRPARHVLWSTPAGVMEFDPRFREWLDGIYPGGSEFEITLNVAGNTESHNPGITDACRDFLLKQFTLTST